MFKRIFIYISVLVSLFACSDDGFDTPLSEIPEDGKLNVHFAIPEMERLSTRTNEDDINSLLMLVFDGEAESSVLRQMEDLTSKLTATNDCEITLDKNIRKNGNLFFVFIANAQYSPIVGTTTLKGVVDYKTEVVSGDYMVMSGESSLYDILSYNTIALYRNGAKITVCNEKKDDSETTVNYPFGVYGTASATSIVAGVKDLMNEASAYSLPENISDTHNMAEYVHPTENSNSDAFVIVKAPFNGNYSYYRLDFKKIDESKKETVLHILPNHHYEFVIKGILSSGYPTPAEAALHPVSSSEVMYDIHDHAPVVYNMITDGTHELGVSHVVKHNSAEEGSETLYVKVFSHDGVYPDFSAGCIKIDPSASSWLSIGNVKEVSEEDKTGTGSDSDTDPNHKGIVYAVTLNFNKTASSGDLEGKLSVNWAGLSRDVPVAWNKTFIATDLFESVDLRINEGNHQIFYEKNYFNFVKNSVWGTSESANNGNPRDAGFHFPIMYGESGKLQSYEYDINFKDLNNGESYDWKAEIEGDNVIKAVEVKANSNNKLKGEGPKITLTRKADDWEYSTGKLVIKVKPTDKPDSPENWTSYKVDLYHTGFFHQDNYKYAVENTYDSSRNWTYYEVVTTDDGSHWLDRNLGARSSELYIRTSAGSTYYGNPDAAGAFYRVADYKTNGGYSVYSDPEMRTGICPPGYDFPTSSQWDALRKSNNFHTEAVGSHYNAAYVAGDKTVYFPKCLYYGVNNELLGESRAGYYWTKTASTGTEKEEIGAWLKCLMISGTATSYINGEVVCPNVNKIPDGVRAASKGYAMNVRCVNKTSKTDEVSKVNFFVEGATHVYLYVEDKTTKQRTAVTTWPGKPIGNFNTADQLFNFLYESTSSRPEEFYVIFNYKGSNGQIHSFSKNNGNPNVCLYSTDKDPNELIGWKVTGDDAPDFSNYGNGTVMTKLGGYWHFCFSEKKGGFTEKAVEPSIPSGKMRVYFKNPGWSQANCYAFNETENIGDSGLNMEKLPTNTDWWYIDIDTKFTNLVFNMNGWGTAQFPGSNQNWPIINRSAGGKNYYTSYNGPNTNERP